MNRNLELEPHKNLKQPYFMNNGPNLPFPSSLIFNYFLKNQTSVAEFENIQTTHRALKIRTEPPEIPGIESEINFSKKIAIENNENIERGFTLKGIKKKLNSFLLNKNKETPKDEFFIEDYLVAMVKQFIFRLKKTLIQRNLNFVSDDMLKMINDNSYYSHSKEYSSNNLLYYLNYASSSALHYLNVNIPILYPFDNFRVLWDIIHFILIMFLLFYIPIDVCFHCDIPLFLHLFITSFFLLDIILNFNTGYFYKGFMVANRKTIAKHYISNLFLWDGLTAFILLFDYNFHIYFTEKDTNVNFYKFLFFFRIKTFKSLYNRLLEKFRVSIRVHTSLIELFNLLFVSSIILHLFACFWYYLAFVHSDNPDYETWLTNKQLLSESIANKYIHSLYWSAVTIMTVGYGDIVAYNTEEVCFVIFTVLVGCIVFAYIINSIGMIVGEIDKQNIMFKYVL